MRDKIAVCLAFLTYFKDLFQTIFGMACISGLVLAAFPLVHWAILL